jgi:molybdopterin/thiamine biosynthesis adenylyltransferase
MDTDKNDTISYQEAFAAQVMAWGTSGQERLRNAQVHIVGVGHLGSALVPFLRAAGIGCISADDGQRVEPDNLNSFVFRHDDLGKPKVLAVAEWLPRWDDFQFHPIPLPVEADDVDQYIKASDLVICCANTVTGRLVTEEKAIRYGKPSIQVAVFDACDCLGGLITVRLPENASACAGCFLDTEHNWAPAQSLVATVTSALAAIAANMAVSILSGVHAEIFHEKTLFYFDLQSYYPIEPLCVARRNECRLCGSVGEVGV